MRHNIQTGDLETETLCVVGKYERIARWIGCEGEGEGNKGNLSVPMYVPTPPVLRKKAAGQLFLVFPSSRDWRMQRLFPLSTKKSRNAFQQAAISQRRVHYQL